MRGQPRWRALVLCIAGLWVLAPFRGTPLALHVHSERALSASPPCSYAMTLFIPAMWAIIRFFHAAAHLTLVTSGVMARELAAQVRLMWMLGCACCRCTPHAGHQRRHGA